MMAPWGPGKLEFWGSGSLLPGALELILGPKYSVYKRLNLCSYRQQSMCNWLVEMNLPEEFSPTYEAPKFRISVADFFKPGTLDAHCIVRSAARAGYMGFPYHKGILPEQVARVFLLRE